MSRPRTQTIGTLGRSPARASKAPQFASPATPPLPSNPGPSRGAVRQWIAAALFDNVALKFLSLVLAVTVFLLVNTDRDSEISVRVQLASQGLPADKVLVQELPDDVRVTIRGSWRYLRGFDERRIQPIAIDLSRAPTGDIALTPDMIRTSSGKLPVGVTVESISPRTIRVAFERRVEKLVPVIPNIVGHPKHGYVITGIKAQPASVKVRGGEGVIDALTSLRTHDVEVEGAGDELVAQTQVIAPQAVQIEGSSEVDVHVAVSEAAITRKLPAQPVVIRGGVDATKWTVEPAQLDVTLSGSLRAIEAAQPITLVVKLSAGDDKAHDAQVTVEGADGVDVKLSADHVKVVPVH